MPGAQCSCTCLNEAARVVSRVCLTSFACSAAAPSAPRVGTSRVLTAPGSGAFAKTTTSVPSRAVIAQRELGRVGAKPIGEAQPPHQKDGAKHPVFFPAARRRDEAVPQAERGTEAFQPLGQLDVLHQR